MSTCRINILPHKLFQLNQSKIVSKFFFGQVINAFNRIGICQIPIFLHPIFKWLSILSNSIFLGAKTGLGYLPGGHLPPPKFGHFPPPKKTFARRTTATPNFFSLFLAHFSWLFRLTAHGGHQGWEGGGA